MWNFHNCFSTLEFPGVSQNFAEVPVVKACFVWNFQGQSDNYKYSRGLFKNVCPQLTLFGFSLE